MRVFQQVQRPKEKPVQESFHSPSVNTPFNSSPVVSREPKIKSLYQQRVSTNVDEAKEDQTDLLVVVRQKITKAVMEVPGLLDRKETVEGKMEIRRIISQTFRNADIPFLMKKEADYHIEEFYNDLCGYGPIQTLLNDPYITEITVYGPFKVMVEKDGVERPEETIRFRDREHLVDIIQRIVSPIGRKVDLMTPIVDAFLPDGSRVNVVLDPIAVGGPYVSIRKFVPQLTIEELCRRGAFGEEIIPVLKVTAEATLNIAVSGGTGGGKTTLLNAIGRFIPAKESIITIEDTLELDLDHPKVRKLLTRPANTEGKGEITTKHLVKTALRMKPRRLLIGEVRDDAINDCLSAMNTGHPGSMFSGHANSPQELAGRVEFMSGLPRDTILSAFGQTMHIIYQVNQLDDGRRRMTHISQVAGYKSGEVIVDDLFEFDYEKDRLIRTNVPFYFEKQLRNRKIEIPTILKELGSQ